MTLRVLPEADEETLDAAVWYEQQNLGLGGDFLAERERALQRVSENPQSFARLEYCHGSEEVRRCVMQRFPCAVIFACRPHEVAVVAVSQLHREPLYWLKRLDD